MEISDYHKKVLEALICPYCKSTTHVVSETDIYGKEYRGRAVIACINFPECDSYVGTHDNGTTLGRLANKPLRDSKRNAHTWFDKIWKEKLFERTALYEELADYLKLPDEYTHIGMFNITTCQKVELWSKDKYYELK